MTGNVGEEEREARGVDRLRVGGDDRWIGRVMAVWKEQRGWTSTRMTGEKKQSVRGKGSAKENGVSDLM